MNVTPTTKKKKTFWKKKTFEKIDPQKSHFFSIPQRLYKNLHPYKRFSPHFKGPRPVKNPEELPQPDTTTCECYLNQKMEKQASQYFSNMRKKKFFWKNWPPKISIFSPYHKSVSKFAHIRDFHPTLKAPRPVKNPEELHNPTLPLVNVIWTRKWKNKHHNTFQTWEKKKHFWKNWPPKNLNFFSIPQMCIKICPYKRFSPHFKGPRPVKNPEELPQPDTTTCECYLNQKMEKQASQYFSNMRKKKLLKKLTPKNLNFFSIPQICIKICPYKRFSPHFKGPQTRQKSGETPTTRHYPLVNVIWTRKWKNKASQYFSNMRKKKILKKLTPKNLNFFSIPQICIKICTYKNFAHIRDFHPTLKAPRPVKNPEELPQPDTSTCECYLNQKMEKQASQYFSNMRKKNFWKNWPPKISIFSPYHKSVSKFAHIRDFHPTLKAPRPVKNPEELPQPDTTTCECYLNQKMEKQASQYFSNMRKKKFLKKLTPKISIFSPYHKWHCIKICPYKRFSPHFKGPQTRQKSGGTPNSH